MTKEPVLRTRRWALWDANGKDIIDRVEITYAEDKQPPEFQTVNGRTYQHIKGMYIFQYDSTEEKDVHQD